MARDESIPEKRRAADPVRDVAVQAESGTRGRPPRDLRGGHYEQARAANERGDNYMLAVVLFAASLFFAGISTKMATLGARAAILGLGCILFRAAVSWLLTFPVQLTT